MSLRLSEGETPEELKRFRMKRTIAADFEFIERYGRVLGPYGLSIYLALWHHADDKGTCWPSYQRMAQLVGISRSQAMRTVYRLEALGLIEIVPRVFDGEWTTNLYQL